MEVNPVQPEITPKQKQFLNFLESEITRTGKAPSLRQAAISQMIKALEGKGLLKRDGHYSRTIHLLNRSRQSAGVMRWREVPVIGSIAAGLPLYAQQEWGSE